MRINMSIPPPPRRIKRYLYKTSPKSRVFRFALPLTALAAALLLFVADGFSPPSAQANHRLPTPAGLQVEPLRTNDDGTVDVLFSWNASEGATRYYYRHRLWTVGQGDSGGWTGGTARDGNTSAEIKGLDPHKRYEFEVQAQANGHTSSWFSIHLQFGPGGGTVVSVADEDDPSLTHANLNGSRIKVILESGNNNPTFATTGLLASHFTFPKYHEKFTGRLFSLDGLSASNVVRDSATQVTLSLAYSGGRFFTDQYLRVKIDRDALVMPGGFAPFDLTTTGTGLQGKIHHETKANPRPALPKVTGVQAVPLCEGEYPESERNSVCNAPVRQEGGKPVGGVLEVYWDQVADEQEIAAYEVEYRSSGASAWDARAQGVQQGLQRELRVPGAPGELRSPSASRHL